MVTAVWGDLYRTEPLRLGLPSSPLNGGHMAKKNEPPEDLRKFKTQIHNWMIEDGIVAEIGPYAWTVYIVLAEHANWISGSAFPGHHTIMRKTGIKTHRAIANAMAKLKSAGLIDYSFKKSYNYTLTYPANSNLLPKKSRT